MSTGQSSGLKAESYKIIVPWLLGSLITMIAPLLFLAGIAAAAVVDLESRQTAAQITTVDLAVNRGAPIHRASGAHSLFSFNSTPDFIDRDSLWGPEH
jgi:hypothetical protein